MTAMWSQCDGIWSKCVSTWWNVCSCVINMVVEADARNAGSLSAGSGRFAYPGILLQFIKKQLHACKFHHTTSALKHTISL